MKLQELKAKRANLVAQMRAKLDASNGNPEGDALTAYEQMEADITDLGNQIKRLESLEAAERELESPGRGSELDDGINTPAPSAQAEAERAAQQYSAAFFDFVRNGDRASDENHALLLNRSMSGLPQNALEVGTNTNGGFLVPQEWQRALIKDLAEIVVIRKYARATPTATLQNLPIRTSRGQFGWLDESEDYNDTNPNFANVQLGAHKIGGIIPVSDEMLQDSFYNVEAELRMDALEDFADKEEDAFIDGDGVNKPLGLFRTASVGGVAIVNNAGLSADGITGDELIDLQHNLKKQYRRNAVFITSDVMAKKIRKLKDGEGNYLWRPGALLGAPDMLLGSAFDTSDSVPLPAASGKSILYGDLSYYRIGDRLNMTVQRLNELLRRKGQVGFQFTKRLDAVLTLAQAVTFHEHSL